MVTVRRADHEARNRPNPNKASVRDLWEWAAPWISRGILIVIGVFGLVFASASSSRAQSLAGFATAGLAGLIFTLRLRRDFDGNNDGLLLDIWISRIETLWLFLPAMVLLGIAGAIVAVSVQDQDSVFRFVGIALFIVCAALAFVNSVRCIGGVAAQSQNGSLGGCSDSNLERRPQ